MKQQSLQVICYYSDEGDLQQILLQSFCLYIDRILAQRYETAVS